MNEERRRTYGPCAVCEAVDQDSSPKLVRYCRICKVSMCEDCRVNYWKRMQAALWAGLAGVSKEDE